MGSETPETYYYILRQFNDSMETIHWQTVIWGLSTAKYICLSACLSVCLSVCLWVCLSVYHKGILPLDSDLFKIPHCLGLKHNFFRERETSPSQNNPNWSTQREYVVVTLDHPGNSGGERVCPVFQGLWARTTKSDCMSVCLPHAYYPLCLKFWLVSLIIIWYMLSVDRALFVKAYTCN